MKLKDNIGTVIGAEKKIQYFYSTKHIHAGVFSSWLRRTRVMLLKGNGVNVPCGECKACCMSSKFIHIAKEETKSLSVIPKKLLFPAPLLPKGSKILGYNEKGHCPMLIKDNCSIYDYRPRTCRNYDCRIFLAAGLEADDDDKALINKQIINFRFSYPTQMDLILHSSVKSAAKFIIEHAECFPDGRTPSSSSQLAILAIKVYEAFLNCDQASVSTFDKLSISEKAKFIIELSKRFDMKRDSLNSSSL